MKNIKENKISYHLIIVSFMFLNFIGSIFIGSSLEFIFNVHINGVSFYIFPIITILIAKYILNKDGEKIKWKELILILLIFYFIIIILTIINNRIWDFSYDSRMYHQEGVIRLKEGWNPFYKSIDSNIKNWVLHYAKAPWIFESVIYDIIGKIESAKVLTTFIPIVIGILGFAISYLVTNKKLVISILVGILLIINPINIAQMFTYYVDSIMGMYIIILIINLFLIMFYKDLVYFKYFSLVNIATFLVNIKFTGLAYCCVVLGIFVICNFIYNRKNIIKIIVFLLVSFIFAVGIIGFNPYVTNTLNNGNPLYPLSGKDKIDIMTENTPKEFRYDSEFEKGLKANIAMPSTNNYDGKSPKDIDQMFKVDNGTIEIYAAADSRLRGFGVYSIIFLPISLLLLLYLLIRCKDKKLKICSSLMILGLAFVVLYCGEFWWSRYISFIWFIPILVSMIFTTNFGKIHKFIGWILIALILFNCTFILNSVIKQKIEWSENLKVEIHNNNVIRNDEFKFSNINKYKELGLAYDLER